jgi:metal-responsive CopG/Arc/MetJ family transcriptional regulator
MMKAVQFTIEEELLRQIDRDPEVKRLGRSAFLRRAAREYLARRREISIKAAYRRGYGEQPVTADEFGPLMEAQAWPDE